MTSQYPKITDFNQITPGTYYLLTDTEEPHVFIFGKEGSKWTYTNRSHSYNNEGDTCDDDDLRGWILHHEIYILPYEKGEMLMNLWKTGS